jgi:hypothetical protein
MAMSSTRLRANKGCAGEDQTTAENYRPDLLSERAPNRVAQVQDIGAPFEADDQILHLLYFFLHVGRPLWREDGSVICSTILQVQVILRPRVKVMLV